MLISSSSTVSSTNNATYKLAAAEVSDIALREATSYIYNNLTITTSSTNDANNANPIYSATRLATGDAIGTLPNVDENGNALAFTYHSDTGWQNDSYSAKPTLNAPCVTIDGTGVATAYSGLIGCNHGATVNGTYQAGQYTSFYLIERLCQNLAVNEYASSTKCQMTLVPDMGSSFTGTSAPVPKVAYRITIWVYGPLNTNIVTQSLVYADNA